MLMMPRFPSLVLAAAFAAAAPAPGVAADAGTPLGAGEAAGLLGCPVPLATARDYLRARGYVIEGDGAEGFATRYKMSERDSERRLLGSLAVERARRYEVSAAGADAVRFVPRYRETVFATGVLGNRNDTVREFDVPLTTAMREALKDMQREVCSPLAAAPVPGEATPASIDLHQYLQEQCRAGDERACGLLRAR